MRGLIFSKIFSAFFGKTYLVLFFPEMDFYNHPLFLENVLRIVEVIPKCLNNPAVFAIREGSAIYFIFLIYHVYSIISIIA